MLSLSKILISAKKKNIKLFVKKLEGQPVLFKERLMADSLGFLLQKQFYILHNL